jgi:hypothetical protein
MQVSIKRGCQPSWSLAIFNFFFSAKPLGFFTTALQGDCVEKKNYNRSCNKKAAGCYANDCDLLLAFLSALLLRRTPT